MPDFRVYPLKGVNDVEFGMHAVTVRRMLGGDFKQFKRASESFPSDHSYERGILCYYDSDGFLEAMEFHEPARVFLGNINLLSLHFDQAVPLLTKLDQNVMKDGDGADFRSLSIGLYAPGAEDEDEDYVPIEAVLVGRAGYYDFYDQMT